MSSTEVVTVATADVTTDPESGPEDAAAHDSPWIRYCVDYRNTWTNDVVYDAIMEEKPDLSSREDPAISDDFLSFDVVELLFTEEDGINKKTGTTRTSPPARAYHAGPPRYSVRIHSTAILNALNSVVEYYPGEDLQEKPLTLQYPYEILCHHYDELEKFALARRDLDPSATCDLEKDAYSHISLLLKYLDGCVMPQVRAEQELNRNGRYTWQWQWVGFRPGRTFSFKSREQEAWETGVIYRLTGGPFPTTSLRPTPEEWSIEYWTLDYDGVYLGRIRDSIRSFSFDHEKPIDEYWKLLNMPGDYTEPEDADIQESIRLGKLYWELVEGKCQYHDGKAVKFPHSEVGIPFFPDTYLGVVARLVFVNHGPRC